MPKTLKMESVGTCAEALASHIAVLSYDDIPHEVVRHVKILLIDTLGTALAAVPSEWGRTIVSTGGSMAGPGVASALGSGRKMSMVAAAFTNGGLSHALDFDDTYFNAIVHPSCCVVPATFAAAQHSNATGRETIAAAAAGYEVLLRVANAGLNNFFLDDFHTTGFLGPFGAAAATARLLRLDAGRTASALGIVAGLGGGVLQTMLEGHNVKALQAGYAAHGGVLAASLAASGVTGPREIFEGRLGFYRTYLGEGRYDLTALTEGLGEVWYSPQIAIKMYPGAHRHHFFVESAVVLVREHRLELDDIEEIRCYTSAQHHFYNFSPAGYRPPNSHAAKFSVPFLIAAVLRDGRIGPDTFTQQVIADEVLLQLAAKVTYEIRDNAEQPEGRGHVEIRLKDGRRFENIQSYIRGMPERPPSDEDVWQKFRQNAEPLLGEQQALSLHERIHRLEQNPDLGGLFDELDWAART